MSNAIPERLERSDSFRGNQTLKKSGQTIEWTREQLQEFVKCSTDPVYFSSYLKIVDVDKGIIEFKPYEYQKEILKSYYNNRYTVVCASRQTGKCQFGETLMLTRLTSLNKNDIIDESNMTIQEIFNHCKHKAIQN